MKIYGADNIENAFLKGHVTFAVYGMGKMGLPLAAVIAERGGRVIGVDVNPEVVEGLNKGINHVKEEPGLDELVERNVRLGRLKATTDLVSAAKEADVMITLVPAFLNNDRKADLGIVTSVAEAVAQGLETGDFVIIETTVPPGTTKNIIKPILERSGLTAGVDFGLAHCPERTSSGRAIIDISGAYPKVVGGVDRKSSETARDIYRVINKKGVIPVSSSTTAEMVKISEGVYRDVNIALANELAKVAGSNDVDIWEVLEVSNTDPNCNLLKPGSGVGGHCIPVYPWFVINGDSTRLIRTAREINDQMPHYLVDKVCKDLAQKNKDIKGANVLVAGLVYRPGVKETYNTPARPIIEELRARGANVFGYEPVLTEDEMKSLIGVESPNGHRIDCTVYVHNRDYEVKSEAETKVTPLNMFK